MQTTTKCPPSVEILVLRHSKARVLVPTPFNPHKGLAQLRDVDVIAQEAKRWARR